ncbi:CaiB/BaiF CoA transferase family protein [Roseovarius sp.]|uniref:CaiB/BaiF CoA transferase family protein n=1 Tax=Roseovarius sp. TaxID=1486281 RepID=UPI003A98866B
MKPLSGLKIIELAGIGPAPFCGMVLADMGAEVVRIDRPSAADLGLDTNPELEVLNRGKTSVAVDLKSREGVALVLELIEQADAVIEGFRPGVTERLGLGPAECHALNPKLVYGRVTGWGQTGPSSHMAGHDINYLALSGVLNAVGRAGQAPVPPLNLVGDFGGGGMLLAVGVLASLLKAATTGHGDIVDAAMTDGALLLMAGIFSLRAEGMWSDDRGTNVLDTGAPFYNVYETADGRYLAVGSIEGRFFKELVTRLGLPEDFLDLQWDRQAWPKLRLALQARIAERTMAQWTETFEGSDACVTPVLTLAEAAGHPQFTERGAFIEPGGLPQPAAAPRFADTPAHQPGKPPAPGADTTAVLARWGVPSGRISELIAASVVVQKD